MKMDRGSVDPATINTVGWILGIAVLADGCVQYWGWPAALIVVGAFLSIWPLVKQFGS